MRFTNIHIQNFRNIEDVEFAPDPHLNVFVGTNGAGKTNFLKAIRIGCAGLFIENDDIESGHYLQKDDIRWYTFSDENGDEQFVDSEGGITLTYKANILHNEDEWLHTLSGRASRTTISGAKFIRDISKNIVTQAKDPNTVTQFPLVAFYPTSRTSVERRHYPTSVPKGRMRGYYNALTFSSNVRVLYDWFVGLQDALQKEALKVVLSGNVATHSVNITELELIDQVISIAFSDYPLTDENLELVNVSFDKNPDREDIKIKRNRKPSIFVDSASDGQRNLFWLFFDLTFRAITLNPHLGRAACEEAEGVVVIDEVDLFLHPGAQQRILPALRKIFPKIQFFVATHSPQVLGSVESKHIWIVDEGKLARTEFETFGDEIDNITENVLGATPRLKALDKLLTTYREFVDNRKEDSDEAKELREKLDNEYPQSHIKGLLAAIDFQIAFRKA